jgi:hypothetical protein
VKTAPYLQQRVGWRTFALLGLAALFFAVLPFISVVLDAWLKPVAVLGFVCGILWAIEYFIRNVWPTPYRIERPSGHLVRIHRRKRTAEILTPVGWQLIAAPDSDLEQRRSF